jgi:Helix-turn-helix domain
MIWPNVAEGAENDCFMASKFKIDHEWLDLRQIREYAPGICERTLRGWLRRATDALPAVRVDGKILIRRSEFDAWLERHRVQPDEPIDVDGIVEDVLRDED